MAYVVNIEGFMINPDKILYAQTDDADEKILNIFLEEGKLISIEYDDGEKAEKGKENLEQKLFDGHIAGQRR